MVAVCNEKIFIYAGKLEKHVKAVRKLYILVVNIRQRSE